MAKLDKDYEFPLYIFHSGKNYKAYEFFGCHRIKGDTFAFRVWAPHAQSVSTVGDFNDWNESAGVMKKISDGIFEAKIDNVKIYDCYKYAITTKDGNVIMKADPYAFQDPARHQRFTKQANTAGMIRLGKRQIRVTFLKSPLIFTKFILAAGKGTKTAISYHTGKWQRNLCLT